MIDDESNTSPTSTTHTEQDSAGTGSESTATRKRSTKKAAAKSAEASPRAPAKRTAAKKSAPRAGVKTTKPGPDATTDSTSPDATSDTQSAKSAKATKASGATKSTKSRKSTKSTTSESADEGANPTSHSDPDATDQPTTAKRSRRSTRAVSFSAPEPDTDSTGTTAAPSVPLLFQAPDTEAVVSRPKRTAKSTTAAKSPAEESTALARDDASESDTEVEGDSEGGTTRRRRRGGRGRRRRPDSAAAPEGDDELVADGAGESDESDGPAVGDDDDEPGSTRRRRRRRRGVAGDDAQLGDDPPNTVVRIREPRVKSDPTTIKGSTRLEAKKQRRREGREAGRRRPAILTEAEFLARRESVDRVMAVRERDGRIQIAVLEDGVLVEHYVNRSGNTSMVGGVYLGKVQNVLPSMEAAFVDVGRGRNAVLYAGEVNWDAAGLEGQPKRIELALKSGDDILVQVTKEPVGHKGARLTSQISLPGRFLVYVPGGSMTGISRKLPEVERNRLKKLLRRLIPEDGGVIVRTAAEGASEEELVGDVTRLLTQWEQIQEASKKASKSAPELLHGEPDLAIKIVRDIFNEDFNKLIVSGAGAWDTVEEYVTSVAPDLVDRLEKWVGNKDIFTEYRVDEQLAKALDRKVYLPSGGSLVIDRTEAMTVVDVNTGKFTGQGGGLEETVTRNNIEAAEEIVRQLRLRDVGGIIVIDFIDMVLESNRDAVLRRLVECLGRDRTKHQVAEVTSLGLVQMTRKKLGQGLLEVFSEPCECCNGRGVKILAEPTEPKVRDAADEPSVRRTRRAKAATPEPTVVETPPAVLAAIESIAEAAAHSHQSEAESFDSSAASPATEPTVDADGPPPQAPPAATGRQRRRRAATRAAGPATPGGSDPV